MQCHEWDARLLSPFVVELVVEGVYGLTLNWSGTGLPFNILSVETSFQGCTAVVGRQIAPAIYSVSEDYNGSSELEHLLTCL
jgi:hypothetical protein